MYWDWGAASWCGVVSVSAWPAHDARVRTGITLVFSRKLVGTDGRLCWADDRAAWLHTRVWPTAIERSLAEFGPCSVCTLYCCFLPSGRVGFFRGLADDVLCFVLCYFTARVAWRALLMGSLSGIPSFFRSDQSQRGVEGQRFTHDRRTLDRQR
jgi:hypothetical protein